MNKLQLKISNECERIEEDSEQSAKRHFNAADRWSKYNNYLGVPSVVIAAIASVMSFSSLPIVGGILAATAASPTAVLTFLKPSERTTTHSAIGNQYLRLRNETRMFREIELPETTDMERISEQLKTFSQKRDDLNEGAPITVNMDYSKANAGIQNGETEYKVDV